MKRLLIIVSLVLLLVVGCGGYIRTKDRCSGCGGTGKDTYMTEDYHVYSRVCPVCSGTGKEMK